MEDPGVCTFCVVISLASCFSRSSLHLLFYCPAMLVSSLSRQRVVETDELLLLCSVWLLIFFLVSTSLKIPCNFAALGKLFVYSLLHSLEQFFLPAGLLYILIVFSIGHLKDIFCRCDLPSSLIFLFFLSPCSHFRMLFFISIQSSSLVTFSCCMYVFSKIFFEFQIV